MNPEVPPGDDVTTEWWDATRVHRLTVQSCPACDHRQYPPRAVCVSCGVTDGLALVGVAGTGIVDTWTQVHRAPRPDVEVPYVVARVRLDEGPILLTRLDGAAPWEIGEVVALDWVDLRDGRALPVFHRTH